VTQGVRFSVCGNTLDTIERETGKRPKINPHAVEVQAGVERLLTLSEGGYTIVRP
jgi:intracellular sulfur oxidation DsrE/DsrF family protein